MAGETIITITGNLTRDPELRTTGNGSTVANFTIAASTRQFNRNTNQWEDGDTLFLNCNAWDTTSAALAGNIANSLSKGMSVIAQGRLMQRSYQAKDGTNRTVVELRVTDIGPNLRRATAQVNRQQGAAAAPPQYAQQGTPGSGAPYQGGATQTATATDPWAEDAAGGDGFGPTFGARADGDDF